MSEIQVDILPSREDNYIYLIRHGSKAFVVDPGESAPVEAHLEKHNLTLTAILLTHHHDDHIAGVAELKKKHGCTVYAPKDGAIPDVDTIVSDGDEVKVEHCTFTVIHTPGHTMGHVVYYDPKHKVLFSGDTLFGGGCGKLFEGTPEDMYSSFLKLGELDPQTKVYCGHEYTKENLAFATSLEPNNPVIADRYEQVENMNCTIPLILKEEFQTNPYFRVDTSTLRTEMGMEGASSTEVFGEIRARKNNFKS